MIVDTLELVRKLRTERYVTKSLCNEAADVIEMLSARIQVWDELCVAEELCKAKIIKNKDAEIQWLRDTLLPFADIRMVLKSVHFAAARRALGILEDVEKED